MTRFTWLQARASLMGVAAVLAALAVTAAITGVQLAHLYSTDIAHCQSGCDLLRSDFGQTDVFMQRALDVLALLAPALLGVFWGAPLLAREFETGTYRLAWTQSVPRTRWLITKLGVGAAMTASVAGLLTLTITWWYRALDNVGANQYSLFERRDIVPIAYAVFAFAVGALAGAVLRRVVPAMATTIGVYAITRIATSLWIRPRLLTPRHTSTSLLDADRFGFASTNGGPVTLEVRGFAGRGSWTLSSDILTSTGQPATNAQTAAFLHTYCPAVATPPPAASLLNHPVHAAPVDAAAFEACRVQAARTFHLLVTYQPAGRYWTFQWLEAAIFVALALAAGAGCYWRTCRSSR